MRIKHDSYYFMKNSSWFDFDDEKDMMVLTDNAPKDDPLIKKSYQEYLNNRELSYKCLFADLSNVDIEDDKAIENKINNITNH